MTMICPSCHKVCRPRAKFCNHCLQSFAGLTACDVCSSLNPTGQACSQCEQQTVADVPVFASATARTVKRPRTPATPSAAGGQRRRFALGGLALAAVLVAGGYAWFSLGTGPWTRAGLDAAASASAAAAAKAATPPRTPVPDSEMITEMKEPEPAPAPEPLPEPAPRPVVVKRAPPPAPVVVASAAPPAPPPEVIAPPAPEPAPAPKPPPRIKTVDEVFNERLSAECSSGLGGLICREKLRFAVCDGRWSQSPPPGQTICRGTPTQ